MEPVRRACRPMEEGQDVMSSKLWRQLVDRLSNQATRRGGVAIEDPGMLTLQPPQDSGELVRATLYTDESGTDRTVIVTTGFAHRLTRASMTRTMSTTCA